jgi:hypothetical protein
MQYQSLTKEERDTAIAEAIHSREVEYFHYDLNAANYQELLDQMSDVPDALPENFRQFKGKARDAIIVGANTTEDASMILAIEEKQRLKKLLQSEKHERAKVEKYHNQLVSKFQNAEELTAAISAAKTKRDAEKLNKPV